MSTKSKPIMVLISDVHYDLKTLKVADSALRKAIKTAAELDLPLIINGDLHTTKANLRGECTNALIETFQLALSNGVQINMNVGNHDKINEKSEDHVLNFLAPFCNYIVNGPQKFSFNEFKFYIIPYYHDVNALRVYLKTLPKGSTLLIHQGLNGSDAGEYFNDHSALNPEDVADFRVISGHYHRRQDIKTGRPQKGAVGLWSFIGNPFTLDFGEVDHPEKGYQILYDDGTLEFVPTRERRHRKVEMHVDDLYWKVDRSAPNDILWIVVKGPSDKLTKVTKESLGILQPFRLELISTDEVMPGEAAKKLDFDSVIDSAAVDKDRKPRLKTLWKDLIANEDTTSKSN